MAHDRLPETESESADHEGRDGSLPAPRGEAKPAPLLDDCGTRLEIGHAAIASRSLSDTTRQAAPYSGEVRKAAARGKGVPGLRSAMMRPGRAAMTTMRCD